MAKDKEKVEYISITLRMLFLVLGGTGFAMSIACLSGCDFVRYIPKDPPSGVTDNRDPEFQNVTIAFVGLFKYEPNFDGCRAISDDFESLTWQFTMAQVCATLATILAGAAIGFLLVDLCLCRFPCGRILVSSLFLAAFVSQLLTFLVYTAKFCDPNYTDGPFPCEPDTASWFSAVAVILFLLCALMSCCAPKPTPLCITTRRAIQSDRSDPCCALCAKKDLDEKEEDEEETAEEEGEHLTAEVSLSVGHVRDTIMELLLAAKLLCHFCWL